MRRLCVLILLAAGCRESGPARELRSQLRELNEASREIERELAPLQKEMTEARQKKDEAAIEKIQAKAEPIVRRLEPVIQKQQKLHRAILDKADAGLKASPDDPALLDVRSQVHEMYGLPGDAQGGQPPPPPLETLLADTERLVRLRPGDRTFSVRHAAALRRNGRYAEARRQLAPVLQAEPAHTRALVEDGFAAYCLDEYETAVARIEAAKDCPEFLRREAENTLTAAREHVGFWKQEQALRKRDEAAQLPQVRLVTSKGDLVLELFEDDAPNTVANFVSLVDAKLYDGTKFHRIIQNFMAQGGDAGGGRPGYTIKDEMPEGKYRRHFRGSLAMALSGPDTGASQFYVAHRPTEHLDGKHTVFGRLLSGLDVLDKLATGDELKEATVLRRRDHPYKPLIEK